MIPPIPFRHIFVSATGGAVRGCSFFGGEASAEAGATTGGDGGGFGDI